MYHMNKDLPYEQQMKVLLHYYDKVVEENEALRARIKELEEEKVKCGDPKELHDQLKALPPSVKCCVMWLMKEKPDSIGWRRS